MAMTKSEKEALVRADVWAAILPVLQEKFGEVLDVNISEYTIPCVFADGEEGYVNVSVACKRSRDGVAYDGYTDHEEWVLEKEAKEEKAKARKEKSARLQAEKEAKRKARTDKFNAAEARRQKEREKKEGENSTEN